MAIDWSPAHLGQELLLKNQELFSIQKVIAFFDQRNKMTSPNFRINSLRQWGVTVNGSRLLWGVMKCFKIDCGDSCTTQWID